MIICDLMMPNMDGEELLAKVKKDPRFSSIPFLVLTVVSDAEKEIELIESGADAYCEKVVSRRVLLEKVAELLGKTPPS